MQQNHHEIVLFRQWNVLLCQIQLRQQFSWSDASVCWNLSWITQNPLTRNLSRQSSKVYLVWKYPHKDILMTVSLSEAESPPGTQVQVTDSDIQRDSWLFILWFSMELYADRHLDYFSYCYHTYKIVILLQDAFIAMVVKECFFPCYVPLPTYVHNFHHFNCKFSYLRHWWDNHFGAITWSFFSCPWFLYNEELRWEFPITFSTSFLSLKRHNYKHFEVKAYLCKMLCSWWLLTLYGLYPLYGIKNKLCRCFPGRVNVIADQVRILCSNKNIKLWNDFFNRLVINNRKWLHRTLSELFIVAYHLVPSARISEIQIKA